MAAKTDHPGAAELTTEEFNAIIALYAARSAQSIRLRTPRPIPPHMTKDENDAVCQLQISARHDDSRAEAEIVHRTTDMFAEYFGDDVRPYTMVLVDEVVDGGFGRADEVFDLKALAKMKGNDGSA